MVVYAGASGLVLPSTPCSEKQKILDALDGLQAGGSTNGGAGIELAYKVARRNLHLGRHQPGHPGHRRRLQRRRHEPGRADPNHRRATPSPGVFLTVLGFGMGNYKDSTLEKLADKRQRQLRLHRHAAGSPQGPRRTDRRDAGHDRQGRQDPGRVQSARSRRLPADRLREPSPARPGLQRRHQGRRRNRRRAHGDRAL